MKQRSMQETKILRKELYLKKKINGSKTRDLAKEYGLHTTYVNKLIRNYIEYDMVVPVDICEMVTEECAQSTEPETPRSIVVIVFDKNDMRANIELSIDVPIAETIEQYELEIQKAIIDKLKYSLPGKPFNLASV